VLTAFQEIQYLLTDISGSGNRFFSQQGMAANKISGTMDQQTGKYVIITGICVVVAGILIYFFHDYFKWLGKLPGDIRIEKGNTRFYFPIVTMLVISAVVALIINIIKRLL
jgi:Protein of unknown function (DUF2905)